MVRTLQSVISSRLAVAATFTVLLLPIFATTNETLQRPTELNQQPATVSVMSIAGVLLDTATQQPIPNARVFWSNSHPPINVSPVLSGVSESNLQGRFVIENLPPGAYNLRAQKEGFALAVDKQAAAVGVWVIVPVGGLTDVELKMVRTATITGRIIDSQGRAISNAQVALARNRYDDMGERLLMRVGLAATVNTNDKGEFRLFGIEPGEFYLTVGPSFPFSMSSRLSSNGTISLLRTYYPGTTDFSSAVPLSVKAAQVLDIGSLVVPSAPNARVRFQFSPAGSQPNLRFLDFRSELNSCCATLSAPASDWGKLDEMDISLPAGRFDFMIRWLAPEGWLYGRASGSVASGENVAMDVAMQPTTRVVSNAFIEDSNGNRQPATNVVFQLRSSGVGPTISGKSDASGVVVLENVPNGTYQLQLVMGSEVYLVSATSGGRDVLRGGVEVRGETVIEVLMRTPGGTIRGVVMNSKKETVAASTVVLVPDERTETHRYRIAVSDSKGRFELRGIPPGAYEVLAWPALDGAPYRNPEFLKNFNGTGRTANIDGSNRLNIDLPLSDEAPK